MNTNVDLDLLVLGSGVAGLSAAVRAADALGLRVGVSDEGRARSSRDALGARRRRGRAGGRPRLHRPASRRHALGRRRAVRRRSRAGARRRGTGPGHGAHRHGRRVRSFGRRTARARTRGRAHPSAASCTQAAPRRAPRSSARSSRRCGARRSRCSRGRSHSTSSWRLAGAEASPPSQLTAARARSGPPMCWSRLADRARSSTSPRTLSSRQATAWRWRCGPASRSPTSSSSSSIRRRCTIRRCRGRCSRRRFAVTVRCCATRRANGSSTSCCRGMRSLER